MIRPHSSGWPVEVVMVEVEVEDVKTEHDNSCEGGAWLRIPPNKERRAERQDQDPPPAWLQPPLAPQLWFWGPWGNSIFLITPGGRSCCSRIVLNVCCLLATTGGLFSAECGVSPGARLPGTHRAVTGQWRGIAHRASCARTGQI